MKAKICLFIMICLMFASIVCGNNLDQPTKFKGDNFLKPIKIIVVKDRVFILDSADQTLKIIDKQGKILHTIGRRGQGPGEFMNVTDFSVLAGKIYILDATGNKIEMFSAREGKHLGAKKIKLNSSFRFYKYDNNFYIVALRFQPGQKIITKFADKKELIKQKAFLDCEPLNQRNMAYIYKNFGFIACLKQRIYFAYTISNKVLEFSTDGEILRTFLLPLESIVVSKLKQSPNMILKIAVNYDIRVINDDLYLLSRDNKREETIIYKLESDSFKEKFRISEHLLSFDISDKQIWGIDAEEFEVLIYKMK